MLRLIVKILCFPTQVIEGIFYLLRLILRSLGSFWALLTIIVWYGYAQQAQICIKGTPAYVSFCEVYESNAIWFLWGIYALVRTKFPPIPPPAWWRLPSAKPKKVKPPKEISASIVIKPHAQSKQTRQTMTHRLNPELQAYLAKASKP